MKPLYALLAVAVLASSAQANPDPDALLRQLGYDPASEIVRLAREDGVIQTVYRGDPEENSLDSLLAANKQNGARAFITTRDFIRRLKRNFAGTEVPKQFYDAIYLTVEERRLSARKLAESIAG